MRALLLVAALSLASCGLSSGDALDPTYSNDCAIDDDCLRGSCSEGICALEQFESERSLIVEVQRPESTTSRAPRSWALQIGATRRPLDQQIALPAMVRVVGRVRSSQGRVPAKLVFRRRGVVDGALPSSFEVFTNSELTPGLDGEVTDFRADLVAGATYDVSVEPSDDLITIGDNDPAAALRVFPPAHIVGLVAADASDAEFRRDILFPNALGTPCAPGQLAGCTLAGEVVSSTGNDVIFERGLQVRAIAKATGQLVSSVGATNDNGAFSIRLSENAGDFILHITPGRDADVFPTILVDPAFLPAGGGAIRVLVPRLDTIRTKITVKTEGAAAVANASLSLATDTVFDPELQLVGAFSATAVTDEHGMAELDLLPGFYSITVSPVQTTGIGLGAAQASVPVLNADNTGAVETTLVVQPQTEIVGTIDTLNFDPAFGVLVRARALSSPQRSRETSTNSDGLFALSLDVGGYDLVVKPDALSGFPWVVRPSIALQPGSTMFDMTLQPPVIIDGSVMLGNGEPASDFIVRAYELSDDDRTITLAETRADGDGRYRLLVNEN